MVTKKLAITEGKKDLVRIIPFKETKDTIDLKISLLNNDYLIYFSSFESTISKAANKEITYHSSKPREGKSSIVWIKNPKKEGPKQYEFKFNKIIDAKINGEFPIPICKIEIDNLLHKKYVKKEYHSIYDLDELNQYFSSKVNTVELYIARPNFNADKFSQKWPNISFLTIISSIEYLIKGFKPSNAIYKAIYGEDNPIPLFTGCVFGNFQFLCKAYPNEGVKSNKIIFYENKDYINLLAVTPVQLEYPNDRLTSKLPAYVRDLRMQKQKGFIKKDIAEWYSIFDPALKRLRGTKLDHHGVILPQI